MPKKVIPKASKSADNQRMQKIEGEIKTIGDRSTWLLGFLAIIVATLTAFVFRDLSQNEPNYIYVLTLLIVYLVITCSILLVLLFSFVTPKSRIDENEKRLRYLNFGFRMGIVFALISVLAILGFVIVPLFVYF